MDKVVDHLLVFKGQGDIQDFPGNYTQYRAWAERQQEDKNTAPKNDSRTKTPADRKSETTNMQVKRKMTYKEKRELEQLEKDIVQLEEEQRNIEEALCGNLTDVERITTMSKRLAQVKEELDTKGMRWLELSDIES